MLPRLDDKTRKILRALEEHPALDELQVSSHAEISVTDAYSKLRELTLSGLVKDNEGVYSLNKAALYELIILLRNPQPSATKA